MGHSTTCSIAGFPKFDALGALIKHPGTSAVRSKKPSLISIGFEHRHVNRSIKIQCKGDDGTREGEKCALIISYRVSFDTYTCI